MRFGLNNLGSILAYGLSAVGLIFSLLVLLAGEESLDANVSASIWVTIAMFLVAIAVAVLSSVRGLLINPASLRGALVGVGSLLGIVLVSYLISSGSDYESYKNISESGSRWVSTGLNATYIITLIAAGTVLYSSVHRLGK
ncbi:hypothetical protein EBT31_13945 [bacterium]|jgi:hypothetical protein|nr:hypothetical protein [bacterium]